jgi:hypothetical protein
MTTTIDPPTRRKGHRLTVTWNGRRGSESVSAGLCTCGWESSGASRTVVREQYREHLDRLTYGGGAFCFQSEMAELLDLSTQRVSQLVNSPGFPEPTTTTIGGRPVWLVEKVLAFDRDRSHRPGPRPKEVD